MHVIQGVSKFVCIQTRNSVPFKAEDQKFKRGTFNKREEFVGSDGRSHSVLYHAGFSGQIELNVNILVCRTYLCILHNSR